MTGKSKIRFSTAALSKKYKCDVTRLIRSWKNGKTDFEIAGALGIDVLTIMQIRKEIASICEKERQKGPREFFSFSPPLKNPR